MPASHGFMFAFTTRITSFFKKNAEKVCQLKKNAYLCTRFKTKWTFSSAGLEYLSDRQGVDGSNPPTSTLKGCFPEWPNGADCKSAVFRLRWFESISTHIKDLPIGKSLMIPDHWFVSLQTCCLSVSKCHIFLNFSLLFLLLKVNLPDDSCSMSSRGFTVSMP